MPCQIQCQFWWGVGGEGEVPKIFPICFPEYFPIIFWPQNFFFANFFFFLGKNNFFFGGLFFFGHGSRARSELTGSRSGRRGARAVRLLWSRRRTVLLCRIYRIHLYLRKTRLRLFTVGRRHSRRCFGTCSGTGIGRTRMLLLGTVISKTIIQSIIYILTQRRRHVTLRRCQVTIFCHLYN